MLHEVSFKSFNERDTVYGWIYVPAAPAKGIVQLIHGFGEHSRRYLHMIVKFLDAGYIVPADDHVGHGKTAVENGTWGDWGGKGCHTMMEDEHTLTTLVTEKYPGLPYFLFGHSMGSMIARDYAAKYGSELAGLTICGTCGRSGARQRLPPSFPKPLPRAKGKSRIPPFPQSSWGGCANTAGISRLEMSGSARTFTSSRTMRMIPLMRSQNPHPTGPCTILPR